MSLRYELDCWTNIQMRAIKGCTHRAIILCDGPSIGIESNNLRLWYSGNSYPSDLELSSMSKDT